MADPTISVRILTDASDATKGISDTTDNLKKLDSAAGDAAKKTRDISGGIESVGDTAGRATTGLRDMSDAVAMAGFPQFAAGMQVAAVGLESLDGAANLFKASQEAITKGGKKVIEMLKLQTIATNITTGAQKVAAIATNLFGKAMNFLKVAILTNPIFWIVAILVGIAVAFVLLYQRCEGFRQVVDAVFSFVWNLIKTVFNAFQAIVRTVIDWVVAYFQLIWKVWKTVFDTVVNIVKGAIELVKKYIGWVVDTANDVVDKVKDVFAKVYDWITAPFKKAMDWIKDHVKLPKIDLPFVGGKSATVSAVGMVRAGTGTAVHAPAGGTIVININGPTDPHGTVRELRRLFREDQARLGRTALRPVVA